jgi:hypothetical protein
MSPSWSPAGRLMALAAIHVTLWDDVRHGLTIATCWGLQAAVAARTYRLTRRAALLKGQLAMAQGRPATFPTEGPSEL